MEAIMRRMPSKDSLERHRAKVAGFAAGLAVPIVAIMLFMALWTGEGIGTETGPSAVTIYPNL